MIVDFFYAVALGLLFAIGVFQLLRRDLIKSVMGFGLLFTGVNLFILRLVRSVETRHLIPPA